MIRDPANTMRPQVALGSAQLGLAYGIAGTTTVQSVEESHALLELAWTSGIRRFDTAPGYGLAEQRIGQFIADQQLAGQLEVCTKLPALRAGDTAVTEWVDEHVTGSMQALQVHKLDCFLLHHAADLHTHQQALMDALLSQQARGAIGRIGISVYSPQDLDLLERFPQLSAVQLPANLFDHRFLPMLRDSTSLAGIEVQIRSVFLQGMLTMKPDALPQHLADARAPLEELWTLCGEHDLDPTVLALAYALQLPADFVVLGVDNPQQLTKNLEDMADAVSTELIAAVESIFAELPAGVIDPRSW